PNQECVAMTLDETIDQIIKPSKESPPKSSLQGHEFQLRSHRFRGKPLGGDETSYFRHLHAGKDDRIFYRITLGDQKGTYEAEITRIQWRGPLVIDRTDEIHVDVTNAWTQLSGNMQD